MYNSLSRRGFVRAAACSGAALMAAPAVLRNRYRLFAWSSSDYSERAIRLVKESTVIDMLCILTLDFEKQGRWFTRPDAFPDSEFEKWRASGLTAMHPAVGMGGPNVHYDTLAFLAGWNGFIASRSDFMRVDSVDDFDKAKRAGQVGVILGLQNSEHFRTPNDVALFHGLGQRVSQLTYNARNLIGNGSTERRDEGISDFGVAVINKMNEVGMAVDVSHCGDRTSFEAFEISKKPVLITHSNVRALAGGHPRCKPDDVIQQVKKAGSVMGITGVRMFVKAEEPTTIEDYLNHIDYVVRLTGPEHVGIGSDIDLDGYDDMPPEQNRRLRAGYKSSYAFRDRIDIEGVDHPKRMYDVTEGLIRRKYSDEQIRGILGGNFKRVLGEIWNVPPTTPRTPQRGA
jgi:membrane dipeptidase